MGSHLPRFITVIGNPDLRCVILHQPYLFGRQCSTQRSNDIWYAGLGHRNHIQITFHNYQLLQVAHTPQQIDAIHIVTFVEDGVISRVKVLGLGRPHRSGAKADGLSIAIDNGKHGSVSESIITACLPDGHKPGGLGLLRSETF